MYLGDHGYVAQIFYDRRVIHITNGSSVRIAVVGDISANIRFEPKADITLGDDLRS